MTRRRIASETVALTRRYLTQPEPFWEGRSDRQVRKLHGMLRLATAPNERRSDVVEEILAVARIRTHHAPAPLYLPNIGSSGSHWLEAMLARATGVHACGEVYFPKGLLDSLPPGADVEFFVNAVLALHTGSSGPALVGGRFVNSAHVSRISRVSARTPGALTVLLVRHPVDIVMSRTLRKAEYRQDIAPGLDDRAYLERNCQVVERFFRDACQERYHATVRYEDLFTDPAESLGKLIAQLGLETTPEALAHAIESTSPDAIKGAAERGERKVTNLYLGAPVRADPDLKQVACKLLAACCDRLGYPLESARS